MLQTNTKDGPLLISVTAFAEYVGLKEVTVRQKVGRREIASVLLGRRRLIPVSELSRLIEENLIPALPRLSTPER